MVYCKHCNKTYREDLMELEDGYYYCHACGQSIEKKPATDDEINDTDDEDLRDKNA